MTTREKDQDLAPAAAKTGGRALQNRDGQVREDLQQVTDREREPARQGATAE